jgi:hypothetical protein
MSVSTLKKSETSSTMSGQACPPEIMTVLTLRGQLRAAGRRAPFTKEVMDMITVIRAEIPSGEDGDGWNTITRNWRGGSGKPTGGERRPDHRGEHRGEHRADHRADHRTDHRADHRADHRTDHRTDHRADHRTDHRADHRGSAPTNQWNVRGGGRSNDAPSAFKDSHRRPQQNHTESDEWTTVGSKQDSRRQNDNPFASTSQKTGQQVRSSSGPFQSGRAPAPISAASSTMTPLTVPHQSETVQSAPPQGGGAGGTDIVSPTPVTTSRASDAPATRGRYTSIFKTATAPVESKIISIIQNKLNKFSIANYDDVCDFIKQILGSGETEFISEFMKLVFSKAAMEETFCPIYARLVKDLSVDYPSLTAEMQTLYAKFPTIFEEVDESSTTNMEEYIERNKQRRYRQGYSQFLTELLKQGIVEPAPFTTTVRMIITQMCVVSKQDGKTNVMEEYMNCLTRILKALAEKTPEADTMRTSLLPVIAEELTPLTTMSAERPSLTNRIRIGIMNALDALKKASASSGKR